MADALEATSFDSGDAVVKQGEPGDDFYIIVEGSATVTQYRTEGEDSQEVRRVEGRRVSVTSGRSAGALRLLR